ELEAFSISVPIQKHEQSKYGQIAEAENHHQARNLIDVVHHGDGRSIRQPNLTFMPGEHADEKSKDEPQRIDVEQNHEEQSGIQSKRDIILQRVPAKELVLGVPDDQ